jgi:hypothetical protein
LVEEALLSKTLKRQNKSHPEQEPAQRKSPIGYVSPAGPGGLADLEGQIFFRGRGIHEW